MRGPKLRPPREAAELYDFHDALREALDLDPIARRDGRAWSPRRRPEIERFFRVFDMWTAPTPRRGSNIDGYDGGDGGDT